MRTSVGAFETVTAGLATLIAGMSLTLPIDVARTTDTTALQVDLLANSVPRAIAAGAVVALTVAVFATTVNHGLAAWGSALFGAALLLVTHLAGRHSGPETSLSTLNFLDATAGGVLLGGIATAVLHGRPQVFGWTFGGLAGIVVGSAQQVPRGDDRGGPAGFGNWPAVDSPPLWLIVVTLALVAVGTVINRNRTQVERRSVELPMAPILAGLLYVMVTLLAAEWLTGRAGDPIDIALSVGATVVAGLLAAMLLPRRDGTLVLLAVALTAVGSAIMPSGLPTWSTAPLLALLAAGIVLGFRRPGPLFALLVLGALALYAALTVGIGAHGRVRAVVCGVVLALAAGYCFGSAAPRYNPTRVLGITIVFMPSVVLALRDRMDRDDFGTVTVEGGHWFLCQVPTSNSPAPSWTALAITIGCFAGLVALRRLRAPAVAPVTPPTENSAEQK